MWQKQLERLERVPVQREDVTGGVRAGRLQVALMLAALSALVTAFAGPGDGLTVWVNVLLAVLLLVVQVLLAVRVLTAAWAGELLAWGGAAAVSAGVGVALCAPAGVDVVTLLLSTVWLAVLSVVGGGVGRAPVVGVVWRALPVVLAVVALAAVGSGASPHAGAVLLALVQVVLAGEVLQVTTRSSASREEERARRLQALAVQDPLTGLENRLGLELELGAALRAHGASGEGFALLFLDLDGFKAVNDTLGHDAGDLLLREVSARLGTVRRGSDVLARLGGDEFVLLARGAGPDAAREITVRVQQAFQVPFVNSGGLPIDASVGYSTCPADGRDMPALLGVADQRMYLVKRARKARRAVRTEAPEGLNILDIIARLEQGQLALDAVRGGDGEVTLRLSSPDHPTLTPEDIAASSRNNGQQEQLWGWWTARAAEVLCREDAPDVTVMPVPLSVMFPGFAGTLVRALEGRGVAPSRLLVEVPGSSVHRSSGQLREYGALIDAGVRLRLNERAQEPDAQQISRDLAKVMNANLESLELQRAPAEA